MKIEITAQMQEKLQDYLYQLILNDNKDKPELDDELSNNLYDACFDAIGDLIEIRI